MNRFTKGRSVKPILEQLEDRIQPSFLLAGAVQQLTTPLNNMISDMKTAQTDLQAQFALLVANTPPANTFPGAEVIADKMVSDFQRILNDAAAIKAIVANEVAFIQAAATAEFTEGDNTDLLILLVGPLIGFTPTKSLTDLVTQANNILNDPNVQSIVNMNLHTVNTHVDSTTPIVQETVAPTF
ncbi:MAG TPA: hypothetical protein VH592_18350 [Gemmataceae bacterium]|jgi:hypothetical protein